MKYLGMVCLLIGQLSAMDRPLQSKESSSKAKLSSVIDIKKLDGFFNILQEKKFEPNYKQYVFAARRLYIHDDLLSEFAARHKVSKPEMKTLLENFLNLAMQDLYNRFLLQNDLIEEYKKEGLTQEQAKTILLLIGLIQEYNEAQGYEDTKTEKFLLSKTKQELETINKITQNAFIDKSVLRRFLQIFPTGLLVLKNLQSQSSELIAERATLMVTKKQQQNADSLYQLYKEGVSDFDSYLQLKNNSELDRIRSLLEESRKPEIQMYLLQKMPQNEINNFSHIYYKIADILKTRNKSRKIPQELPNNYKLLYLFVDRFIKEGDKFIVTVNDQDKKKIKEAANTIVENQNALNALAEWLSIKPQVLRIIVEKVKNIPIVMRQMHPWPDYPEEAASAEALAKLPIIQEPSRVVTAQDFINYALDNNPRLNALIKDSSDEQLQAVSSNVDTLIKADEKVVKKYQEQFEVAPRRDLAKLRSLMQSIDQELKRRKEEFYRKHPVAKPHPEYPESPR